MIIYLINKILTTRNNAKLSARLIIFCFQEIKIKILIKSNGIIRRRKKNLYESSSSHTTLTNQKKNFNQPNHYKNI
jgi:hypothetical protein